MAGAQQGFGEKYRLRFCQQYAGFDKIVMTPRGKAIKPHISIKKQ